MQSTWAAHTFFAAFAWLVQRQYTRGGFPFDLLEKLFNPLAAEARVRLLLPGHQALTDVNATPSSTAASNALHLPGLPGRQRWTSSQLEPQAQFYRDHHRDVDATGARNSTSRQLYRTPCPEAELDLETLEDVRSSAGCPFCRLTHEEIQLWLKDRTPIDLSTTITLQFVRPLSVEGKVYLDSRCSLVIKQTMSECNKATPMAMRCRTVQSLSGSCILTGLMWTWHGRG